MAIRIRPMQRRDLTEADRIVRLAFGTFLGLPEPQKMFGDIDMVRTRFAAAPDLALAAEYEETLVGSNFVTRWGSFGFFGPLSVEPRLWNQRIAQQLMEATVALFEKSGCQHTGLFTFSDSPKHIALYQKFDYWPRFLTFVMSKEVATITIPPEYSLFSELPPSQKEQAVAACRESTSAIFDGLDVTREIMAVESQRLGDTVIRLDGSAMSAFAGCHVGPNSEAGSGSCYVKFGMVRPGPSAQQSFRRLLELCEAYAARRNASRLVGGVNTSRYEAYRTMVASVMSLK